MVSMQCEKIILEIIRKDLKTVQAGIQYQGNTLCQYETIDISIDTIESNWKKMLKRLNHQARTQMNDITISELRDFGIDLSEKLLSAEIKKQLIRSDAEYLLLNIDDQLVHLPWEFIVINHQFLFERFVMGRQVKVRHNVHQTKRQSHMPHSLWIVCNPGDDLKSASKEAENLCSFMDQLNRNQESPVIRADHDYNIDIQTLKDNLKKYDMIHYAGHHDYHPEDKTGHGWRLSDAYITPKDIDCMAVGDDMPLIVFSNACESARSDVWHETSDCSRDLGQAFLRAGVRHYVGTLWELDDQMGGMFAQRFYQHLFDNHTIGKALWRTKMEMAMQNNSSLSAITYILYGDPTWRYDLHASDQDNPTRSTSRTSLFPNRRKWMPLSQNVIGLISVLVLFLSFLLITHQSENKSQHVQPEILKYLLAQDEANERRFNQWIQNHKQQIPSQNITQNFDNWTSEPFPMAIITGSALQSYLNNRNMDGLIASSIEFYLYQFQRITLLDRMAMASMIKETKLLQTDLIAQPHGKPKIIFARYHLILNVLLTASSYHLSMRLKDLLSSKVIYAANGQMEHPEFFSKQAKNMTADLIYFIKEQYPIRGRVISSDPHKITLNIGYDMGVRVNQSCQIVNSQEKISIKTVQMRTSIAEPIQGYTLDIGNKIICLQ